MALPEVHPRELNSTGDSKLIPYKDSKLYKV
jgi:hypothetical protein